MYQDTAARFTISNDKHLLLRNPMPFFYLGDTGWERFHRVNRKQAGYYLKRRAEQGFTVVQAVVLAELDGLHTPIVYGEFPIINDNRCQSDEAHFRHVNSIIKKAEKFNMVIGLFPTWSDKIFNNIRGKGPEIFKPQTTRQYGEWPGQR